MKRIFVCSCVAFAGLVACVIMELGRHDRNRRSRRSLSRSTPSRTASMCCSLKITGCRRLPWISGTTSDRSTKTREEQASRISSST